MRGVFRVAGVENTRSRLPEIPVPGADALVAAGQRQVGEANGCFHAMPRALESGRGGTQAIDLFGLRMGAAFAVGYRKHHVEAAGARIGMAGVAYTREGKGLGVAVAEVPVPLGDEPGG